MLDEALLSEVLLAEFADSFFDLVLKLIAGGYLSVLESDMLLVWISVS